MFEVFETGYVNYPPDKSLHGRRFEVLGTYQKFPNCVYYIISFLDGMYNGNKASVFHDSLLVKGRGQLDG